MVFLSSAARPSVALLVLILAPISTFSFPLPPDNLTLAEQIFPPAIIYRSLRDADRSDDTVTAPSQPPFPYFRRTFLFGTSQPSSRLAQQLNVTIITPYKDSERFIGAAWWGMGVLALILILVTGLLAGLTLGVMSVDLTRLRVWNRTGNRERRWEELRSTTGLTGLGVEKTANIVGLWIRKQAQMILDIREHSNWLLTSLILSSVAVAEGLPLILSHLFEAGAWKPFVFATLLVTLFGELVPQAIMPMYILQVAGKFMWFVKGIMWVTWPLSGPIGWVFRKFKNWSTRGQRYRADGILEMDELVEFIKLHEASEGFGGEVESEVGKNMRRILEGQYMTVGRSNNWVKVYKVDEDQKIDSHLLDCIQRSRVASVLVMRYADRETPTEGSSGEQRPGQVVGIILKRVIVSVDVSGATTYIRDLEILSVPVVRETCRVVVLANWLMNTDARVAVVIPSSDETFDGRKEIVWTQGRNSSHQQIHSDTESCREIGSRLISPLGIVSCYDLWARILRDEDKKNEVSPVEDDLLSHNSGSGGALGGETVLKPGQEHGLRRRSHHRSQEQEHASFDDPADILQSFIVVKRPAKINQAGGHTQPSRTVSAGVVSVTASMKSDSRKSSGSPSYSVSTSARRHGTSRQSIPWANDERARAIARRHEQFTDLNEDEDVAAVMRRAAEMQDDHGQGKKRD